MRRLRALLRLRRSPRFPTVGVATTAPRGLRAKRPLLPRRREASLFQPSSSGRARLLLLLWTSGRNRQRGALLRAVSQSYLMHETFLTRRLSLFCVRVTCRFLWPSRAP